MLAVDCTSMKLELPTSAEYRFPLPLLRVTFLGKLVNGKTLIQWEIGVVGRRSQNDTFLLRYHLILLALPTIDL